MLEKEVESYFRKKAREHRCLCFKFASPGNAGVPDRIIITPYGETMYVELKSPTGKLRPLQKSVQARIRKQGARVCTLHTRADVNVFFTMVVGNR